MFYIRGWGCPGLHSRGFACFNCFKCLKCFKYVAGVAQASTAGVLNVLNVLNILNVLNDLNVLNTWLGLPMPPRPDIQLWTFLAAWVLHVLNVLNDLSVFNVLNALNTSCQLEKSGIGTFTCFKRAGTQQQICDIRFQISDLTMCLNHLKHLKHVKL